MQTSDEEFEIEVESGLVESPPELPPDLSEDERYLTLITKPLEICAQYKPKFGQGGAGISIEEFKVMYGADPFYRWMGLDSDLMYAAHKAAGGMTSVYRQLGIGAQWILNQVIQDRLRLTKEQAAWSYSVPSTKAGKMRKLSLDARIEIADVAKTESQNQVDNWMQAALHKVLLPEANHKAIRGAVFEARQGYKSKDSKRQNADITNAANAYAHSYLPVLLLFSNQFDEELAERYTAAQWLILRGTLSGTSLDSTYVFCKEVIGYDLAAFFQRNSGKIRNNMENTLNALLRVS
jgi:hypothetical protein